MGNTVLIEKELLEEILEVWDDASSADDACVGYKSRARMLNKIRVLLGKEEMSIPDNWRE